ncbi:MAG: hypothetical protein ABI375_10105 [Rudaea sp.]
MQRIAHGHTIALRWLKHTIRCVVKPHAVSTFGSAMRRWSLIAAPDQASKPRFSHGLGLGQILAQQYGAVGADVDQLHGVFIPR